MQQQTERQQNKEYFDRIFQSAREENQAMIQKLSRYAEQHNAWNDHFMQGLSFRDSVDWLEKAERKIFTDRNLQTIKNSSGSGKNFDNLVERIQKHRTYLNQIEMWFDRHFG